MQVIYNLLSAIIIVISVTGLITYNLKGYHYIILIVYVMLMAELGSITNLGQVTGVVMAPILFLILALFIKENRIWNLCVGCIGYLVNITFNNIMLYFVAKTWKIPVDISHILGNLITVIFDYQILRKPLKILSL